MADVRMKKPDGTWVSLKGPAGPAGPAGAASTVPGPQGNPGAAGAPGAAGRSIAVFDQVADPGAAAQAGDIWFEP